MVSVVRYKGSRNIEEMIKHDDYLTAFAHTQHGVERILWNRVVGIFQGEVASGVRKRLVHVSIYACAHERSPRRSHYFDPRSP
jgi:hypothetical protein